MPQGPVKTAKDYDKIFQQAGIVEPPSAAGNFLDNLFTVGNIPRIGLPIIGGALGSIVPGVGTAIGAAGGGALGGILGELFGETIEGDKIRPGNVLMSGALGAIPGGRLAAGAGKEALLKILAREAVKGGGLSALATTGSKVIDEGELPGLSELAGSFAGGAAMGAGSRYGLEKLRGTLKPTAKTVEPVASHTPTVPDNTSALEHFIREQSVAPARAGEFSHSTTTLLDSPAPYKPNYKPGNTYSGGEIPNYHATPSPTGGAVPTDMGFPPEIMGQVQELAAELQKRSGAETPKFTQSLPQTGGKTLGEQKAIADAATPAPPKPKPARIPKPKPTAPAVEAAGTRAADVQARIDKVAADQAAIEAARSSGDPNADIDTRVAATGVDPRAILQNPEAAELAAIRNGIKEVQPSAALKKAQEQARAGVEDKARSAQVSSQPRKPVTKSGRIEAQPALPKVNIISELKSEDPRVQGHGPKDMSAELNGKSLGEVNLIRRNDGWQLATQGKRGQVQIYHLPDFATGAKPEAVVKELNKAFPGTTINHSKIPGVPEDTTKLHANMNPPGGGRGGGRKTQGGPPRSRPIFPTASQKGEASGQTQTANAKTLDALKKAGKVTLQDIDKAIAEFGITHKQANAFREAYEEGLATKMFKGSFVDYVRSKRSSKDPGAHPNVMGEGLTVEDVLTPKQIRDLDIGSHTSYKYKRNPTKGKK